jgi:hypothetical protein
MLTNRRLSGIQTTERINFSGRAMTTNDDYNALVLRIEALLTELDRLQLPLVAAHVDLALRRLEEVIAGIASNDESNQN